MYKISILLIIIGLVTGCSKPVTYQVENSAEIVFEVTNAQYGNAIINLWNETYPEQVGAISYDVVEANDSFELHLAKQPISNDVILVDDIYVPSLFDESLAFESKEQKSYEMEIPYRLTKSFNEYKNTFIPMRLEGMAYAYNTNLLHSSDVLSFERLARLANNAVYINKDEVSILPLLYIGGVNLLADGNVELPYFNSDKTLDLLKEIQWLGTHFDAVDFAKNRQEGVQIELVYFKNIVQYDKLKDIPARKQLNVILKAHRKSGNREKAINCARQFYATPHPVAGCYRRSALKCIQWQNENT